MFDYILYYDYNWLLLAGSLVLACALRLMLSPLWRIGIANWCAIGGLWCIFLSATAIIGIHQNQIFEAVLARHPSGVRVLSVEGREALLAAGDLTAAATFARADRPALCSVATNGAVLFGEYGNGGRGLSLVAPAGRIGLSVNQVMQAGKTLTPLAARNLVRSYPPPRPEPPLVTRAGLVELAPWLGGSLSLALACMFAWWLRGWPRRKIFLTGADGAALGCLLVLVIAFGEARDRPRRLVAAIADLGPLTVVAGASAPAGASLRLAAGPWRFDLAVDRQLPAGAKVEIRHAKGSGLVLVAEVGSVGARLVGAYRDGVSWPIAAPAPLARALYETVQPACGQAAPCSETASR